MKKLVSTLAVAMLAAQPLLATAAWAQASAQPAAGSSPAAAPADPDANKEICKAEPSTGSRLAKKKVCRTKAEWTEYYRQQRQDADQMQRNDMANRTPRSG